MPFPEVESVKNDEKRHGDIVKGLLKEEQYSRNICSLSCLDYHF